MTFENQHIKHYIFMFQSKNNASKLCEYNLLCFKGIKYIENSINNFGVILIFPIKIIPTNQKNLKTKN
jgi:hypothetical protein